MFIHDKAKTVSEAETATGLDALRGLPLRQRRILIGNCAVVLMSEILEAV